MVGGDGEGWGGGVWFVKMKPKTFKLARVQRIGNQIKSTSTITL